MNAAMWKRAKQLLAEAAEWPQADRERYVVDHCTDPELRRDVLAMIATPAPLSDIVASGALKPGADLGPYRIRRLLGRGGMGEVYCAHDPRLGRDIAIKLVPPAFGADSDRLRRFEHEARAAGALNHPNIVTIHSVEEANGIRFLTMELVEGKPLSDLIPKDGMPLDRLLNIGILMADALSAAHGKGIAHRDLKPANVMVGSEGQVKVLDFGLAKLHDVTPAGIDMTGLATEEITGEGRIVGTVAYMSPEQAEGGDVDQRSDIFSLGVILYELATGQRPFGGTTAVSVMTAILRDAPPLVTDVNATLPAELARIVQRCLAKEPTRRYQAAVDLRNDLEELKRDSDISKILASPPVESPHHRRRDAILAIGGVGAIAVIGFAVLLLKSTLPRESSSSGELVERQLTTNGSSDPVDFGAISFDGQYLAYADTNGIHVRLIATGETRSIPAPSGLCFT
jgi:serine/threonine protein kinase